MISIEEQKNLLLDIARQLEKPIIAYAIGGTAMMFLGLKDSTKDIDLVFLNENNRKDFINAARKIGWNYLNAEIVYGGAKNKPIMLEFADSKLDLFFDKVIDFSFSKQMQERASVIRQFEKNLIIKIADVHDLILMKCATDRIKDIDDAKAIIENKNLDYGIIKNEAINQLSLGNERAIFDLGLFLERLNNLGMKIPQDVSDELWFRVNKQISEKQKKRKL